MIWLLLRCDLPWLSWGCHSIKTFVKMWCVCLDVDVLNVLLSIKWLKIYSGPIFSCPMWRLKFLDRPIWWPMFFNSTIWWLKFFEHPTYQPKNGDWIFLGSDQFFLVVGSMVEIKLLYIGWLKTFGNDQIFWTMIKKKFMWWWNFFSHLMW